MTAIIAINAANMALRKSAKKKLDDEMKKFPVWMQVFAADVSRAHGEESAEDNEENNLTESLYKWKERELRDSTNAYEKVNVRHVLLCINFSYLPTLACHTTL